MADDRRYTEDEVAEILERATSTDLAGPRSRTAETDGLTLDQLQEIGSEVGIPPDRIAAAARSVATRPQSAAPSKLLGAPRSVTRTVPTGRPLTDDEWTRLVVEVRETFGAKGRIDAAGNLRTWSNGNLHVFVEPASDGYRVRMTTFKGNALPRVGAGVAAILFGGLSAGLVQAGGDPAGLVIGGVFGALGLGQILVTRASLPRWAAERAAQMNGLAERIRGMLAERVPAGDDSDS